MKFFIPVIIALQVSTSFAVYEVELAKEIDNFTKKQIQIAEQKKLTEESGSEQQGEASAQSTYMDWAKWGISGAAYYTGEGLRLTGDYVRGENKLSDQVTQGALGTIANKYGTEYGSKEAFQTLSGKDYWKNTKLAIGNGFRFLGAKFSGEETSVSRITSHFWQEKKKTDKASLKDIFTSTASALHLTTKSGGISELKDLFWNFVTTVNNSYVFAKPESETEVMGYLLTGIIRAEAMKGYIKKAIAKEQQNKNEPEAIEETKIPTSTISDLFNVYIKSTQKVEQLPELAEFTGESIFRDDLKNKTQDEISKAVGEARSKALNELIEKTWEAENKYIELNNRRINSLRELANSAANPALPQSLQLALPAPDSNNNPASEEQKKEEIDN